MNHIVTWPPAEAGGTGASMAEAVRAAFASGTAIVFDIDAVGDAGLDFVQLVAAARRHADDTGVALSLARPANPAVAALLDRAGVLTAATPADLSFWFHGARPQ